MPANNPINKNVPLTDEFAKSGIICAGTRQYIWTNEDLYKVAVAELGPMDQGTFDSFTQQAKKIAEEKGFKHPLLILDISLKEPNGLGVSDQPYPISREEWDIFVEDARHMAKFMPRVHVVDGTRYTAPI